VCDDGSIFVDQDGEHFGHVLSTCGMAWWRWRSPARVRACRCCVC
jgi:hypothetical protein